MLESVHVLFWSEQCAVRVETEDKESKVLEFLGSHLAVVACFLIELGAATWESSIADGDEVVLVANACVRSMWLLWKK